MKEEAQSNTLDVQGTPYDRLPVGTVVGAHRWPYDANHPDCWGTPWKGVVLALNDRRVWERNVALCTPEKIDAHIAWCLGQGLFRDSIPVLWDFGDRQVVYFQTAVGDGRCHDLRTYAEDYLAWQLARSAARRNDAVRRGLIASPVASSV